MSWNPVRAHGKFLLQNNSKALEIKLSMYKVGKRRQTVCLLIQLGPVAFCAKTKFQGSRNSMLDLRGWELAPSRFSWDLLWGPGRCSLNIDSQALEIDLSKYMVRKRRQTVCLGIQLGPHGEFLLQSKPKAGV